MERQLLMQSEEIQRAISRMAHEILEKNSGTNGLVLIGIRSGGAYLVRRIAQKIEAVAGTPPSVGIVDITAYRDDIARKEITGNSIPDRAPVSVEENTVVLVDDVIYTGRTIRAALDLINHLGKPKRILVATLVDRGNRELPIKADIVGKNVEVADSERVNVLLQESDGIDQVILTERQPSSRMRPEG